MYNEWPYKVCSEFREDPEDGGYCVTCGWIDSEHNVVVKQNDGGSIEVK